jgi:hypothetical protein
MANSRRRENKMSEKEDPQRKKIEKIIGDPSVQVHDSPGEKGIQSLFDKLYGERIVVSKPMQITEKSSIIYFDGKGDMVVPETRQLKCSCGKNMMLFLVTEKNAFPPIWAGKCVRCHAGHVRGKADVVAHMSEKDWRAYVKKGKLMQRRYPQLRHSR